MAESAIAVRDLHKRYGAFEALRGVTLDVPAGSICGFLGRNGAGKTTTMKILLGIAHATSGESRVLGLDDGVEIRQRTGFVSEEKDLYPYMTVGEIVRFTASFYPHWRDDLASHYVRELGAHRKIRSLSRGMRTKLALLLAVCRGAELLIVDEPTSGLDDLRETYRRVELVFENEAPEWSAGVPPAAIGRPARSLVSSPGETPDDCGRDVRAPFAQRKGRVLTIFADRDITEEARALNPISIDVQPLTLKEIFLKVTEEA